MIPRTLPVLLLLTLLLPGTAPAQDADAVTRALVRIVGTRHGDPFQGSGFVVALRGGVATVVTAAHVIQGADVEVVFDGSTERYTSIEVLGMDLGTDLAVFEVRSQLPAGLRVLKLDTENRPKLTDTLLMAGFPGVSREPALRQGILSSRRGTRLVVDRPPEEGLSGGPLLRNGQVVGVVVSGDAAVTMAVNAVIVREFLLGSDVQPRGEVPPPPPAPPPLPVCQSGQKIETDPATGIRFVHICAGEFDMGSDDPDADEDERPVHRVTLSEYSIGQTEVTNAQYRRFQPGHDGDDRLPANVNWHDAKEFCEHYGYQLPTEAQWEYAARAGNPSRWAFGDDERLLKQYAWYGEGSVGIFFGTSKPHPVGTKKANAWRLYDMHGNVWEWVLDWYAPYQKAPQKDPKGPPKPWKSTRVLRGGSFGYGAESLRSAERLPALPEWPRKDLGFRCARAHQP